LFEVKYAQTNVTPTIYDIRTFFLAFEKITLIMPDFIPHGHKGMSIWKGNRKMIKFGMILTESWEIPDVLLFSKA
jgi:hypothetical protein